MKLCVPRRVSCTVTAFAAIVAVSCKREARPIGHSPAPPADITAITPDSGIHRLTDSAASHRLVGSIKAPADSHDVYGGVAYSASEGKRLYEWMNCSGCHSKGGGGIGPALMDAEWRYGAAPSQIYETIVSGRPNGMPSFGRRLNSQQTWQLVAYVRSLSAQTPKWARPGRDDHMAAKVPEQQTPKARPYLPRSPPVP